MIETKQELKEVLPDATHEYIPNEVNADTKIGRLWQWVGISLVRYLVYEDGYTPTEAIDEVTRAIEKGLEKADEYEGEGLHVEILE